MTGSVKSLTYTKSLNKIKLYFASFLIVLLLILPIATSQLINNSLTTNVDSSATTTATPTLFQSWVVSPNGGEIVYGNTEISFFAKSQNSANNKFGFEMNLCRSNSANPSTLVCNKNLFTIPSTQQISDRDGIRSKFVDFTGMTEANDYKLQLITSDPSGQNKITDYSDTFFTISTDSAKPKFESTPPNTNIRKGDTFTYDIKISGVSTYKILAPNLPSWLKLEGNKLSGTPTAEGVFPVILVATTASGRQETQIFNINVKGQKPPVTAKPTPTTIKIISPDSITIKTPEGNKFTKVSSDIESELAADIKSEYVKQIAEISKDGNTWEKIYEGTGTKFTFDISKFDGGDYYLRITYEFKDGQKVLKNHGPIHIIKQSSEQVSNPLAIKDLKPTADSQITDLRPTISAAFEKSSNVNVETKTFKFELDGVDLTQNSDVVISIFSFSYAPKQDLSIGTHKAKISISTDTGFTAVKEWSFEITSSTATSPNHNRNRIIIGAVIAIIILIFILSIWAIILSRKEKEHFKEVTISQ